MSLCLIDRGTFVLSGDNLIIFCKLPRFLCRIRYSEIFQYLLECILCRTASINKVPLFVFPLLKSAVINRFHFIIYYKRDYIIPHYRQEVKLIL